MNKEMELNPNRLIKVLSSNIFQRAFSVVSLAIMLLYTITFVMYVPNSGFLTLYSEDGYSIIDVQPRAERAGFVEGDRIVSIDGKDVGKVFSPLYEAGYQAGQILKYVVERDGVNHDLEIEVASYWADWVLFGSYLVATIIGFVFWLCGLLLSNLNTRDDVRSKMIGLGWLLTGVTVVMSLLGYSSYFYFADVLTPIAISFVGFQLFTAHLYFPVALFSEKTRKLLGLIFFGVATLVSILFIVSQDGDSSLINLYLLVCNLGALGFLFLNFYRSDSASAKRQTRTILAAFFLAFAPMFIFTFLPKMILGESYFSLNFTILFIILLPLAYLYVIYQRKILQIDYIINRIVVTFVLIMVVMLVSTIVLGIVVSALGLSADIPLFGGALAVLLVLPATGLQNRIQISVNRVLYGAHYDFSSVTERMSKNLVSVLDRAKLNEILTRQIAAEMGILQTEFLYIDRETVTVKSATPETFETSLYDDVCKVLIKMKTPTRPDDLWNNVSDEAREKWKIYLWGGLFVPLVINNHLYGILILGSRVSSDIYSDQDVRILSIVAQQGALASANVELVEQLRGLARDLVRSDECRRKMIARDLHDSVLQTLFFVKQGLLDRPDSEEPIGHIDSVIANLRSMIKAQRTSLIDQGLTIALEDLILDMSRLSSASPPVNWNVSSELAGVDLGEERAVTVYRITQEGLSNALKYSKAKQIDISLCLEKQAGFDMVILTIEDDGVGFDLDFNQRSGHYGFLGMRERALMIDSDLQIISAPNKGTKIILEFQL